MSNPPEPVATWHLRFTGREADGRQVVLLDQDIDWLAGPNTSPDRYAFHRWHLFLTGFDPLVPDLAERVAGGLAGLEMVLTDDTGHTVGYGPLNGLPARGGR